MANIVKLLASGITSAPTTSGAVNIEDLNSKEISYQATVVGTGAVSATVIIEVSIDGVGWLSDTSSTLSLTGTTVGSAYLNSNGYWSFARVRVTAISGTGASVTVTMAGQ